MGNLIIYSVLSTHILGTYPVSADKRYIRNIPRAAAFHWNFGQSIGRGVRLAALLQIGGQRLGMCCWWRINRGGQIF